MQTEYIQIPIYFVPRPYQRKAWRLYMSGLYDVIILIWSRQLGKDTFCIQGLNNRSWKNPGTNNVYIGLDNKWVKRNMYDKKIDGRTFWMDYPKNLINPIRSSQTVEFLNNPQDKASAVINFLGFQNEDSIVGSAYNHWVISETGLYKKPKPWDYVKPIWTNKIANDNEQFSMLINGTPRGIKNSYYELIKYFTGEKEPEAFPGEHKTLRGGRCFVDFISADQAYIEDDKHRLVRLFSDAMLDDLRQTCISEYGNDNLFRQEYMCEFTTVNAGLVYQGIEVLTKEGRYRSFNLDPTKPVYMAWDIASKDTTTDASAAIIFQYINNCMMIYDCYEQRAKSLVECITELSREHYFPQIRFAALPWDSKRSASSATPLEEATKQFPNIKFHALQKDSVHRGIELVRKRFPNMVINADRCERLYAAINDYEYKYSETALDWSSKPVHNWASHLCDALRYGSMALEEIKYFRLNDDGTPRQMPTHYGKPIKRKLKRNG